LTMGVHWPIVFSRPRMQTAFPNEGTTVGWEMFVSNLSLPNVITRV
jgi:hypothetical protein